jgi:hypothetical protein
MSALDCRKHAENCLSWAQRPIAPYLRDDMLALAERWLQLADEAEATVERASGEPRLRV